VLGPLVVSATVFAVPDGSAGESMWRLLAPAVAKNISKRSTHVAVNDSKKLYHGLRDGGGLYHLERGVLAMLATLRGVPSTLADLLETVSPDAAGKANAFQWYRPLELQLPRSQTSLDVALASNNVAAAMSQSGVELRGIHSEVVFEEEFNRLTGAANKSSMLLDVACRLLMRLWRDSPSGRINIFIDRQGGRMRYLPGLQRVFEGCRFKVLDENEADSAYLIADKNFEAEIHFSVGCEEKQLPVALASMTSKYLRELFMGIYNNFWAQRVPNLLPTAGYYTDGRRFYQEILPAVRRIGIDQRLLYRSR
jgi:hypothetical protein